MHGRLKIKSSRLAIVPALLLFSFFASGQTLALSYGQGFVAKRSRNIGENRDIQTHFIGGDIKWPTNMPSYSSPDLGLTLHYLNYSYPGIGNSLSAFAFAEKRFRFAESPFGLKAHLGMGIIWVQEVFDIETNLSSQTVSSQLNQGYDIRLGVDYQLNLKSSLELGYNFFHASNMGLLKPNFGLNVPGAYLRYTHRLREVKNPITWTLASERAPFEWLLYYNMGFRQIIYDDPVYFVHNLNVEFSFKANAVLNVTAGASVFQEGIANELEQYDAHYDFGLYSPFSLEQVSMGPYLGGELFVGDFSAFGQLGYYLFHPHRKALARDDVSKQLVDYTDYYNPSYFFNRIGLRYRAGKHWLFSFSGKFQLTKIQYPELGFGYRF